MARQNRNKRIGDKKNELDADIIDFDIVKEGNKVRKVFKAAEKEFDIGV